jgi:hypothetical protein
MDADAQRLTGLLPKLPMSPNVIVAGVGMIPFTKPGASETST